MKPVWIMLPALAAACAPQTSTNANTIAANSGNAAVSTTTNATTSTSTAAGLPTGGNPLLGRWTGTDDCLVDLRDIEFTPTQAIFRAPDASQPSNAASYSQVSSAGATVTIGTGSLQGIAVIHIIDATHALVDPVAGSTDQSCHLTRRS